MKREPVKHEEPTDNEEKTVLDKRPPSSKVSVFSVKVA